MHSEAEGLSTAGVDQMPSTVSPQGEICSQDLEDRFYFFFIIGANTSLFRINYLCFSQNFDDLKQYQPRIVQQMHLRMFIY